LKAKAGLNIKMHIDAMGSRLLSQNYIDHLKQNGIIFKFYHPFRFNHSFLKHINKRDHRKIIIIDSTIAYIGGMNLFSLISHQYNGKQAWRDSHVKILGHMVDKLTYTFKRNFNEIKHRSKRFERFSSHNDIVSTTNRFGRNYIRHFIHRYIKRSKKEIGITMAYFIPDLQTILLLIRAHKRGVKVHIITNSPEQCDVALVNRINRPILKYLIKKGLKVYYYKNRMLHAKSIYFDDKFATIGSSNMNYRSFFRDLEVNAFLRQEKWVDHLKTQFKQDLQNSRQVELKELKNISIWNKAVDMFFYMIRSFF
ncbi:hypothetical protein BVY03_00050, partial [bacterium K02(2017)]